MNEWTRKEAKIFFKVFFYHLLLDIEETYFLEFLSSGWEKSRNCSCHFERFFSFPIVVNDCVTLVELIAMTI